MAISPLVAAPVRLPVGDDSVGATRWDGVPGFVALLALPDAGIEPASYASWAAALAEQGSVVLVLDEPLEAGPAGLATVPALVAALRAEQPDRLVALAGHGVGGIIVADYLASTLPAVDAAVLIAPGVAGARAMTGPRPSLLGRLLGRSDSGGPDLATIGAEGQLDVAARVRLEGPPVRLEIGGLDVPDHRRYGTMLPRFPPGEVVIHSSLRAHEIPLGPDAAGRGEHVAAWLRQRLDDRLRHVGPGAPDFAAMPRAEALAAHESYVAGETGRLEAFRELVARGGGPMLSADREGLAALGAWLHDAIDDRGPRDADPPRISRRYLQGRLARVSSEGLWLADGAATFVMAALREREPALHWALCTDRRDHFFQRTLLEPRHLLPEALAISLLKRLVETDPADEPLVTAWDGLIGGERRAGSEPDDLLPLDEVEVEAYDGPDWDATLWIPEGAEPALGKARFQGLFDQVRALDGVRDLAWEDREVMLLQLAPGTDLARLRGGAVAILRRALRDAEGDEDDDEED